MNTLLQALFLLMLVALVWFTFAPYWRLYRLRRRSEKRTGAYTLFRARDAWIRLVIAGPVKESNAAWSLIYQSINRFLGPDGPRSPVAIVMSQLKVELALRRSAELRDARARLDSQIKDLSMQAPETERIIEEIQEGCVNLVRARSGKFGIATAMLKIKALWIGARFLLFLVTQVLRLFGKRGADCGNGDEEVFAPMSSEFCA